MKKVFAPLADLDFATILRENDGMTQSGRALINSYRQHMLTSESSCTIVNRFMIDAKNHLYDEGVAHIFDKINEAINSNLISWRLASAVESVNASTSSYNYLNRNAARQVEALLENNSEENVVKYIKAGALKNVMYCEAFRSIVNSVYKDASVVISESYKAITPISYTEITDDVLFFEVLGKIYKIADNVIAEAAASEVSREFIAISQLLESSIATFENEMLTVSLPNGTTYEISENEGCCSCKRTAKKKQNGEVKEDVMTFNDVQALREHNNLVINTISPNKRADYTLALESIAKAFEHFAQFAVLSNAKIIESMNDRFLIIEHNDRMFGMSLQSNHTNAWKINDNVVESLNFIKERTHLDLNKEFRANIEKAFENRSEEEKKQIQESIEKEAIDARRAKIEQLTEAFKNDPGKLAILSAIAQELNDMQNNQQQ